MWATIAALQVANTSITQVYAVLLAEITVATNSRGDTGNASARRSSKKLSLTEQKKPLEKELELTREVSETTKVKYCR